MRIAIRVDASSQIGTGHLMRCLTLADALKQRGVQVRFVSRQMPEHLRSMLVAKGHEFTVLKSSPSAAISDGLAHAHWLGTSQYTDAQDSIQALSNQTWDWLIVDHYALDIRWESALRQTAKNILVIDDIADRKHDCDVLLDQNFYADMNTRYTDKVPLHCQLLLGPRYALLRDEFRQLREQVKPRTGPIKRVLICFGGMDSDDYTGRAIDAFANIGIPDLCVDVVIGAQHPGQKQIESACREHGFMCHVQTSRMGELTAAADMAIGAGGSAAWERCCLGLPGIIFAVAENQQRASEALADRGAIFLGQREMFVAELERAVKHLLEPVHLHDMSVKAAKLVDGQGAVRLADALFSRVSR